MRKLISLVMALVMVFGLVSCVTAKPKLGESAPLIQEKIIAPEDTNLAYDVVKIGVILLHDENSTYDLNFIKAVERVKEAYGLADANVILKKNVPEGTECYEAACDLVEAGCNIIFADSFGHESYIVQAAQEYPKVEFCHATGVMAHTLDLPNYHNAFASIYEGRYLAGVAAGLKLEELRRDGKLKGAVPMMGYVGAFTYAEVISGYTSFYLGARSVCPDVQMKVQFTGSWYDETEEKAAAEALIAAGCDLISQHADSMGSPTACEDAGVPNVSYNGSTYEAGANTFIISSRIDWAPYFAYLIERWTRGEQIATDWTGTIESGSVLLTGLNLDVAAEGTKEAIDELLANGFKVFDTEMFTINDGVRLTTWILEGVELIEDGVFMESKMRSAPYFEFNVDGIELVNKKY